MENTLYMDTICASRAIAGFDEDPQAALEGTCTVSLETQGMREEDDLSWVREHFAEFLKLLRFLRREGRAC